MNEKLSDKFAGLALEVDRPERMTILHPVTRKALCDEAGQSAWIELYSGDSEIADKHNRAVSVRRVNEAARSRRRKVTEDDAESQKLDAIDQLACLTTGWHLVDLAGRCIDVPFSREAARDLYGSPGMAWLREQVDEFAFDRANFSKASPKT